jgi:hypothetical protein
MKSGTVLVIGACSALAVLALVARAWRSEVSSELSTTAEPGAAGERRAVGERGSTDARSVNGGRGTDGAGHLKPDGLANGGKGGGTEREAADGAGIDRRDGASTVVRGAARLAGGNLGTAVGAAPDALRPGSAPRGQLPDVTKREVPDLPKQASLTTTADTPDNAVAPEPAPEVAYDGGADHVFSTTSQVQVPDAANITGEAGTVSFWLKPEWGPNSQDDATFVQLGDSSLQVVKNVNFLRFEYLDSNGTENGLGTNIGDWQQEQWRQVTASWNSGNLSLYVDGQLISQNRYQNPPIFGQETKLLVGSDFSGPVAPGQVSNLTVLNRDSSPTEVSQQFQSGGRPRN